MASSQLHENHKSHTTRSKTLHSQQACSAADFELSAWFEVAANCRERAGEERRLRAINLLMCRLPQPAIVVDRSQQAVPEHVLQLTTPTTTRAPNTDRYTNRHTHVRRLLHEVLRLMES